MVRTFISRKVHLGKTGDSVIEWGIITVPIAEIISVKNARAWVSMVSY